MSAWLMIGAAALALALLTLWVMGGAMGQAIPWWSTGAGWLLLAITATGWCIAIAICYGAWSLARYLVGMG